MKARSFASPLLLIIGLAACDDNVSTIGSDLIQGDSTVNIDSLTYDLNGISIENNNYDSRTGTLLLGNIDAPGYGRLDCSFVSRMLSLSKLNLPDSVTTDRVDSCAFKFSIVSGNFTGDSLAPQQLSLYRLDKQLPAGITNAFDPAGYYDPKPLGTLNYTLSSVGKRLKIWNSSTGSTYFDLDVKVPVELGREVISKYRTDGSVFEWPQTFAQYFPGIYVKSTFGNGSIANISDLGFWVYFYNPRTETEVVDSVTISKLVHKRDSVCLFTVAPEVLSSNCVSYKVAQDIKDRVAAGESIITTPGGYVTRFSFPAASIVQDYRDKSKNISIINSLTLSLPAEPIENDRNITVAPYLLCILTREVDTFFAQNKIPDGITSFSAQYDATNRRYYFPSMRSYLLSLLDKETIDPTDTDFTLIPVLLQEEAVSGYYGQTSYYVTGCVPYTLGPSMTLVDTRKAEVVFSFTSQISQ